MKYKVGMSVFFSDGKSAKILEVDPENGYLKFDRFVGVEGQQTRWGFYDEYGMSNNPICPPIEDAYFEYKRGLNLTFETGRRSRIRNVLDISEDGSTYKLEFCRPPLEGSHETIMDLTVDSDLVRRAYFFMPKTLLRGHKLIFEDLTELTITKDAELKPKEFVNVETENGLLRVDYYGRVWNSDNFVFEVR